MTATSTPPLDMLPNMRNVAAVIAKDAHENLAGVDVVSIGRRPWVRHLRRSVRTSCPWLRSDRRREGGRDDRPPE